MKQIYFVVMGLLVSLTLFAEEKSGNLGESLKWSFNNGTLTISGNGEMGAQDTYSCPWMQSKSNNSATIKAEEVKELVIQEGVTSTGENMCWECTNLAKVTLPKSLTKIGKKSFYNCKSLTEIVIPDNVTEIDEEAFGNAQQLAKVTFSKNLKTIGVNAFGSADYDMALTEVDLSKTTIENIGGGAFQGNVNLKKVHLPATFKGFYVMGFTGDESYGESVFGMCNGIEEFICDAKEAPKTDPEAKYNYNFPFNKVEKLVVPAGCEEAYKKAGWTKHATSTLTTGISNVKNTNNQKVDVYTLTGVKCMSNATTETINNLPKGVYLVNGKKIVVK